MEAVALINWACVVRAQLEQMALLCSAKAAQWLAYRHFGVIRIAG
jgi:hypothetical protein